MEATDASLQQNNAAESRLLKSESGEKNTNNIFNSIQNLESVAEKLSWLPKKCYKQHCIFNFPGFADAFHFVSAVMR